MIALLLTILFCTLSIHYLNRKETKNYQSTIQMQNNLSIFGLDYQQELLLKSIPPYFKPQKVKGFVTLFRNLEKIVIFSNYKFTGTTLEDVAKCYRFCNDKKIKNCYILTQMPQRKILTFAQSLDISIVFIHPRKHHDYLKRHNIALPQIIRNKGKRMPVKELIKHTFTKKRARYFILASFSLCFFSIISPFKIYYLIMASLLLVSGIMCIFSPTS